METSAPLQIEKMESLRIARVSVMSESPEIAAFKALIDWAKKNEPEPLNSVRLFGFNDPCPEPGQKVYEYEAWMTVSENARKEGDVSIIDHPGGTYAVIFTPLIKIGEAWLQLYNAVKKSDYKYGAGPALEEALTDPINTPFDKAEMKLYFPIIKA
ncbi:MAG: GyrI-like domain-containing protein [candidate division Zixibacteria bacterium]|nr:GyrI-like domain-containing protein [candidate division Zixibacteria bacterium]